MSPTLCQKSSNSSQMQLNLQKTSPMYTLSAYPGLYGYTGLTWLSWPILAYPGLSWSIPAYSGLFLPIPAYPDISWPILAYPDLFWPIQAYPGISLAILSYPAYTDYPALVLFITRALRGHGWFPCGQLKFKLHYSFNTCEVWSPKLF